MNSTKLLRFALAAALAFGTSAFAATGAASAASASKGTGTAQTHHCQQADGSMDLGKTRKACLAAKGTWAKDGAASAPATAVSAAPRK